MPLSEYEKRALTEIEADLRASDPSWAEHMSARRTPAAAPRAGLRAALTVAAGVLMLLGGVLLAGATAIALALVGYLMIVLSVAWLAGAGCARFGGRDRWHR